MARIPGPGPNGIYEAAGRWLDRCLREDGSLFTPGRSVWTAEVVEDLHRRFVLNPDESDRDFSTKFRRQLEGAQDTTIQLAAEMLYVHFLVARSVTGGTKRKVIRSVLSWAVSPVEIPPDLSAALDEGIASCGTGFNTYRPFLVAVLVEFARVCKRLSPAERQAALSDPWEFRRVLFEVKGTAALLQQHALLHLAFPDSFEPIVSDDQKREIAAAPAYARFVREPQANVDRRLFLIRQGIEQETPGPFQFYDPAHRQDWKRAYWKISPGADAFQWDECRRDGFIAIGWEAFGDVSQMSRAEFDAAHARLAAERGWGVDGPGQVWDFSRLKPGDRIVANRGTTVVLGFGTVTGTYRFVPGERHGHRVPVRWDDVEPRSVNQGGWRRTMIALDKEKFASLLASPRLQADAVREAAASVNDGSDASDVPATLQRPLAPVYDLEQCAEDTHLPIERLRRWLAALDRKGQAVFVGPPGTGKTFVARHLARHLVGGTDGVVGLVQFHPSYAYEDFVQGIRPRTSPSGHVEYPTVPGRFLDFCEDARTRTGTCVLILDEINRANLSRVFGELMFLLEYREESIALAGGTSFSVPSNVRILGTMNTADRSVALVDHALRRRFAFLALYPDYDVLRDFHRETEAIDLVERLVPVLERINDQIADPHYQIGVSFFLRRDLAVHIEDVWRMEIEPYVEEFFFDQPDRVKEMRWESVRVEIAR